MSDLNTRAAVVFGTNRNGGLMWRHDINAPNRDEFLGVDCKGGFVYPVGITTNLSRIVNGAIDCIILRVVASNGSLNWHKTFGSELEDYCTSVAADHVNSYLYVSA